MLTNLCEKDVYSFLKEFMFWCFGSLFCICVLQSAKFSATLCGFSLNMLKRKTERNSGGGGKLCSSCEIVQWTVPLNNSVCRDSKT